MRKESPSLTARKVALVVITLAAKPGMASILPAGLVPATEKFLVASGVVGAKAVRWTRSKWVVAIYDAFDWMLPGEYEAIAHRKAFCERQVRESIAAGATQVLVPGAGYDMLAWRLAAEFPGVNFFEIDHPATARLKAKGIDAMGQRSNLYLIAEDLGKRKLVDVLKRHASWNPDAQTVIVAEALVMYLPVEAVRELFCQCATVVGDDSRIAFTYFPADEKGQLDVGRWTGLMLWLQKLIGEPWLWSIAPEALSPFLRELGWRVDPAQAGTTVKHGVEFYAVASKDSSRSDS